MEDTNSLLIQIKEELAEIKLEIKSLNDKLDKEVTGECKKMGEHIDFVENIYENVKHPLGYVCHKISSVIGNEIENPNALPSIQNGD